MSDQKDSHYSYSVYADPRTAEQFDAARFGGPIGALVADAQERFLVSALAPLEGLAVLDVGTGTGRAAVLLAGSGARVTGVDASAEMLAVATRRAGSSPSIAFARGDAHALAFSNCSFDAAVCLRVIMHTPGWRRVVAELCRVSRRQVVLDYPALASAAALQAVTRRAAALAGRRVEAYRVFSDRAIREVLASHGFRIVRVERQFVLPIALHKAIGSRSFTTRVERSLAAVGLLGLFGSPVTVVAERTA
ncbi:MAG TPA: class I SAM-dependent methyltransferase [Vicinamibacterales bacterium]|nr:class I SAM-dependent methyltransferase [Vicinamibacterales bacterium]